MRKRRWKFVGVRQTPGSRFFIRSRSISIMPDMYATTQRCRAPDSATRHHGNAKIQIEQRCKSSRILTW
eukprot:2341444-Rhodomonas_salina.2